MQLYDHLLQFPLFQGMSRDNLSLVAGHTKFGFLKVAAGQTVVSADDACGQLFFLLSGTLQAETSSDDRAYKVVEHLSAPWQLQPEAIYGYNQRFTHTVIALTECSFITIGKDEVNRLSEQFLVFRLNLLNIFATQSQKLLRQQWHRPPATLAERIVRFLRQHCIYPAGPKTFHILMTRLADEVGDSRLVVSRVLNQMQRDGLIILRRGIIEVAKMEKLIAGE
jgi:CRP-like cAMP-binding protein